MAETSVQAARAAADKARQLANNYERAHRDDPPDAAVSARGVELRRLATEAAGTFNFVQRGARAADASQRRTEKDADDAGLQARLRAESQARRDAAAQAPSTAKRRVRGRR
jgi:hypothetical protein